MAAADTAMVIGDFVGPGGFAMGDGRRKTPRSSCARRPASMWRLSRGRRSLAAVSAFGEVELRRGRVMNAWRPM
jgi:hypothetical protein